MHCESSTLDQQSIEEDAIESRSIYVAWPDKANSARLEYLTMVPPDQPTSAIGENSQTSRRQNNAMDSEEASSSKLMPAKRGSLIALDDLAPSAPLL